MMDVPCLSEHKLRCQTHIDVTPIWSEVEQIASALDVTPCFHTCRSPSILLQVDSMRALLVGVLVQQAHGQGTNPRFSALELIVNLPHFVELHRTLRNRACNTHTHTHTHF